MQATIHRAKPTSVQASAHNAEPRKRCSGRFVLAAWAMALAELLAVVGLAIFLFSRPAVFSFYYRWLHEQGEFQDAQRIVDWVSGKRPALPLPLMGGQLTPKEIRHYEDVRQLFEKVPGAAVLAAIVGALIVYGARERRELFAAAQVRALILFSLFLMASAALAWWDWKTFFAWVHQPFFGSTSWRLGRGAYSLQLFPKAFWQITGCTVIAFTGLLLACLQLVSLRLKTRQSNTLMRSSSARLPHSHRRSMHSSARG
ncbi:MAG: DUF1461 domain-containing protein [Verrucomicrobiota bacterium]